MPKRSDPHTINNAIEILRLLAADVHTHNDLPSYKDVTITLIVEYNEDAPVAKFRAAVGYDHSCEGSDLLLVINELQHRMDFDDKYKKGRTLKAIAAPTRDDEPDYMKSTTSLYKD